MDNTEQFGISFCAGYAGLDLGLELAGVKSRTVAYVEIEAFAIANLVAKMEQNLLVPAPVWTNLKTFPMDKFRGRVDFITAGYPCQPFSVAGQRKGTDDPRHLWPYIRRIYQTIQPRWMFFENVEGHVTLGLSTVISDLEEDDYRVKAGLFTASEVGAPHRRKRVFILAESKSRLPGESSEWKGRKSIGGGSKEEIVADTETSKCEQSRRARDGWKGSADYCWPARPGEPQHDWEEPRVTQSGVGGTTDGASSRVDRLRLLGNGVVPQQAARAYILLKARMDLEG